MKTYDVTVPEIANMHLVAHEVPRLVIADAVPGDGLLGHAGEVIYRHIVRLGFHQPVTHVLSNFPNRVIQLILSAILPQCWR